MSDFSSVFKVLVILAVGSPQLMTLQSANKKVFLKIHELAYICSALVSVYSQTCLKGSPKGNTKIGG